MRSPHINVMVDLDAVRAAAEQIRARTGVRVIAVIKADAYGLGAARVADVLGPVVDEFGYFSLYEAEQVRRPGLIIGPPMGEASTHRELGLRPAVGNLADAQRFKGLPVAISVDVGMQRFGCEPADLDALVEQCDVSEYFAHAVTVEGARKLAAACAERGRPYHAAATDLLDDPETWFDAVRPGLALYRDAVRVTTRLHTVRATSGRVGYGGFTCSRVGVILGGYSNLLQPAPVLINGRPQRILECGMNTSYVSVAEVDRVGDTVTLLGGALSTAAVAADLGVREHQVLCRYTATGPREYLRHGEDPGD